VVANKGIPNREAPWPEWEKQNIEWRAWHRIVLAMHDLGMDMNDPKYNALVAAVRDWAEWNTELHREQGFEHHELPYFDANAVGDAMEAIKKVD